VPLMIKLEPNPPKRQMTGSPETDGRIIYIQNCQSCDTAELTGQPPSIPSLVDIVARLGADRVKTTIQHGASTMPAFTNLSEKRLTRWSPILLIRRKLTFRLTYLRASQLRALLFHLRYLELRRLLDQLWIHELQRRSAQQTTLVDPHRL